MLVFKLKNWECLAPKLAKPQDDNKYLSAPLIKASMGWHYKRYSKSKKLALFEDNATKNKIGLWLDNNPIAPSEWRRTN